MDQEKTSLQDVKSTIEKVVNEYTIEQGYETYEVSFAGTARNYSSVAKRITIIGIKDRRKLTKFLFVKTLTDSKARNERMKLASKFEREKTMYQTIFKEFEELQKELPNHKKFPFIGCVKSESNFLILEDLMKRDYEDVSNNRNTQEVDLISIMVQELAKFHAFSFALKQKNPKKFEELTEELDDIFIAPRRAKSVFERSLQFAVDAMLDDEVKTKLIKNGANIIEIATQQASPAKYGVICHGDYNLRNVLFKYNELRKPTAMVMIDFQLSHYSSPVRDIFFLVSSSMSTQLRDQHYGDQLKLYYDSLSTFLELLQCDVSRCYPREEFEKDFKCHFPMAFFKSLVTLRVLCSPDKSDEDLDKMYEGPNGGGSIFDYNCSDAEKEYKERINGLMNHYVKLNFI